ncbi:hypothetical protein [Mycobacterium sp. URHD0025]|uniref:DUF7255 family protein n=1 Tax=Mycobacterium sp. URHD0025 TaxID=1298864 RepID=UPI000416B2A6|nr:hypothetical protein [Mycobacterium sp. URHD0025]
MPVGATQHAFAELARRDGIDLVPQSLPWLNRRGHLGLPADVVDHATLGALERIYRALGGDLSMLATATTTPLRGDFIHPETGTLVEVDESQHFTSFRLQTFGFYPASTRLGFDAEAYLSACATWQRSSDGYFRTKAARGFGQGGRQRQRAYYDALRDLASPAMGLPPLIRIEAADRDPDGACRRHRQRLLAALG